ncbi:MAG: hypothetical protein LBJ13_03815 [Puniceicoccales bacterium]|nr:hypothetical protein [Puniceicoccales bacterium]
MVLEIKLNGTGGSFLESIACNLIDLFLHYLCYIWLKKAFYGINILTK